MQSNFDDCLARVLVSEGGKVDNPKDPGGRTNKGVTQNTYAAWLRLNKLPMADVFNITTTQVRAIYKAQYWDVINGDQLPDGVDYFVFDGAVNSGPGQATKWLQRALGLTGGDVDGHLGQQTLDAVLAYTDDDALIWRMANRRMAFLKALKTWPTFGDGWAVRVAHVEQVSQAEATGLTSSPPMPLPAAASAKANPADARTPASGVVGHVGAGIGAASVALPQVTQALTPVASLPGIEHLLTALTVAGVVVALAGLAYGAYAASQKKALADALNTAVA